MNVPQGTFVIPQQTTGDYVVALVALIAWMLPKIKLTTEKTMQTDIIEPEFVSIPLSHVYLCFASLRYAVLC